MQCSKLGTGRDTNKIFYNRRNTKGVLLLSKMVYKRVRGLGLGAELPSIIEHFHLPGSISVSLFLRHLFLGI